MSPRESHVHNLWGRRHCLYEGYQAVTEGDSVMLGLATDTSGPVRSIRRMDPSVMWTIALYTHTKKL